MRTFLLLLLLFVPYKLNPQVIVGYYYGNYEGYPHDLIEYNCLTHIAHAFIYPDSNGVLKYDDWFLYPELISAAHENGKKIVVSVGGWGNSYGFKSMVNSYEKEMNFIDSLVHFIKRHDYDGADIDWEYPAPEEKYKYHMFLCNLRSAFDTAGIELLSVAIPAVDWNNVFDKHIAGYLDWVGIMTYDFYGPWEKITGHNTALYSTSKQMLSVDYSIKHYLSKGYPKEKLLVGMEYVGYKFNSEGLHKPHKGAKSIAYNKSTGLIKEGWEYNWDDSAKVPYYFNPDSLQFITIDDPISIAYKANYLLDNHLGGVIIWKVGLDYHNGFNEFLNIVGDHLFSVKPGVPELVYPYNEEFVNLDTWLEWSPARGAGQYQLQVSTTPNFKFPFIDKLVKSTKYLSSAGGYWRVRGVTEEQKGEWSEVRKFYNSNMSASSSFSIEKDTLSFYSFNEPGTYLSLKILDIYSKEEAVLADGYVEGREKRIKYLPERFPYIIRLVINNQTLSHIIFRDNYWSASNPDISRRYRELYPLAE